MGKFLIYEEWLNSVWHETIKRLEKMGCLLIRHGGRHDWYQNPRTKISQPIPRHREINENLAKHIIKMLGNTLESK